MSSVFAHSLVAASIYNMRSRSASALPRSRHIRNKLANFLWLSWLIVIASFPDLDYIIPLLHSSANQGLRITHSVIFSLIAPLITIGLLWQFKISKENLIVYSLQAFAAGLSHLILDLLVGVTPLPLLFPLNLHKFRLPFGILPSAGRIDFGNYYLYRNLYLEMGVLLPILGLVCLYGDRSFDKPQHRKMVFSIKFLASGILIVCCWHFIRLNLALPR